MISAQNLRYPNGNCKYGIDIYDRSGRFIGTFCCFESLKKQLDDKCTLWSRNQAIKGMCLKPHYDKAKSIFDEDSEE